MFGEVHLGEGKVEGQCRFCTLVLVDPILVQPVTATSAVGIVEGQSQIVAAEEPFECPLRLA